jgi:TPP-dependent pyruvate/acetoin dehydrogenase alpha subunit
MATKDSPKTFSLISRRKLLALYAALLRCRMIKEFAASPRGKTRTGHEAPAVAVVHDLKPGDTVAASARDFLPAFVDGTPIRTILAASRTAASHASFSATIKSAIAAARKHTQSKNRRVAAIFATGSDASSSAWHSALRTAGAERLPILFVSQRSTAPAPLSKSATHTIEGFPAINADRDDVVALYRVAFEALAHARRGNGPTLIECIAWPFAQDDSAPDAILTMERYLAQSGISYARTKRKTVEDFVRELKKK